MSIEHNDTVEGHLCALLLRWSEEQGLECHSADEMLNEAINASSAPDLERDARVKWLTAYVALWDASGI